MSVLDKQPTKPGQRVQETFSDTRGWLVALVTVDGEQMAEVDWDTPNEHDGDLFPVEALRVVEVIAIDVDHYEDPAMHPMVEVSYTPEGGDTNFVVNVPKLGQHTLKGVDQMRLWLLGFHRTDRS